MKVLVDTCVWSHALRHKSPDKMIINQLKDLINDSRVEIIGPIRQETLSGISNQSLFNILKEKLSAFEDIPLETNDFIFAAELCNKCRKKGLQGSTIDFLICSVSINHQLFIFTTDKDFSQYKRYCDIKLFE